jgi:hypothetical protein
MADDADTCATQGRAAATARKNAANAVEESLVQGLWGHFVYVGCLDEPGAPASLVAEHDGAQTITVKMCDPD